MPRPTVGVARGCESMAAHRAIALAGAAGLVATLLTSAAMAGVRVTGSYASTHFPSTRDEKFNLHVAGGIMTGEGATGPSGSIALESFATRHLSIVLRAEYAETDESQDFFSFRIDSRSEVTYLAAGVRAVDESGCFRSFAEAGGGVGLLHGELTIRGFGSSATMSASDRRFAFDLGMGTSWRPPRSPVGPFVELRMLDFTGPGSFVLFPIHAGLQVTPGP